MSMLTKEEELELHCRLNKDYPPLRTPPKAQSSISICFSQWLETGDPDYLDKIIIVIDSHGLEIKGVLLEQLAIASYKRLKREFHYGKKTKVNKSVPSDQANWNIFKLMHFCKYNLEDAAFLSSGWLDKTFPEYGLKASVLNLRYPQWRDKNIDSIDYVKSIRPDGWNKEEQEIFLASFPKSVSNHLKGERR